MKSIVAVLRDYFQDAEDATNRQGNIPSDLPGDLGNRIKNAVCQVAAFFFLLTNF